MEICYFVRRSISKTESKILLFLYALHKKDEATDISFICEQTSICKSTTYVLLNRLVEKGLVVQEWLELQVPRNVTPPKILLQKITEQGIKVCEEALLNKSMHQDKDI